MGQQQILLIIVGIILVGIAVAVGITMFKDQAKISSTDALLKDMNYLAWMAVQQYMRAGNMSGWAREYPSDIDVGDLAPSWTGGANDNGTYTVEWQNADEIVIKGTSKLYPDVAKQITVTADRVGNPTDQ